MPKKLIQVDFLHLTIFEPEIPESGGVLFVDVDLVEKILDICGDRHLTSVPEPHDDAANIICQIWPI